MDEFWIRIISNTITAGCVGFLVYNGSYGVATFVALFAVLMILGTK